MRRGVGIDRAVVLAAREVRQPRAQPAVAGSELALAEPSELPDHGNSVGG